MSSVSRFEFDIPNGFRYETVEYFQGAAGVCRSLPDMIFLGVRHGTEEYTVPSFIRSLEEREKYQIIFEKPSNTEISKDMVHYLDAIPPELDKKGWEDPDHVRYVNRIRRLEHFINVIQSYPDKYTAEQFEYASEIIWPLYRDYILKQPRSGLFKRVEYPIFPNYKEQDSVEFYRSIDLLRQMIDDLKTQVSEDEYLIRQKKLCESIESESSKGRPSIWVAGASHYSKKAAKQHPIKADRAALRLFKETVRKTGKSAIVVIAIEPKFSSSC